MLPVAEKQSTCRENEVFYLRISSVNVTKSAVYSATCSEQCNCDSWN